MSNGPAQEQALVVIGASAGGIDALERVAAALPADFPAAIVVAQHLDPSHASMLDSIIRQHTQLKVVPISGAAELIAGTIYIIPAGEDAKISAGKVTTTPHTAARGPVPSIDALFESAAAAYGDRAVGVILSGTGSDGPSGVLAIKEAGGLIVVQDPQTAAYPSLPSSIPPNLVDFNIGIDSIGGLLATVVSDGDASAESLDSEVLHAFLTQLRLRSGIDFTQYKTGTIRRRLARLMAAARCKTLSDYMRYLNAKPEAYQRLVSSFLIKVTGFFRDPALFRSLREEVLPYIIENAREHKTEIRVWSAGCATGEEAYSIAILFADILGDKLDDMDIRVFATDLDPDSIAFARRGLYPAAAFAEMPEGLLHKYFTQVDDSYQIKKRIRTLTIFGEYDLGQRAPFPRIDLILCRNVLIYFTKDLQQRTLQLFAFSLREGGYLVLGKSETTSPLPQYFSTVDPMLKIFHRQGERVMLAPPAFTRSSASGELANRHNANRIAMLRQRVQQGHGDGRWSLTERLGAFFFESPIGLAVVDRNYDIQTINQSARVMLGIHGQGIGEDLIHLASGLSAQELKSLVDAAFRNQKAVPREILVNDTALGETQYFEVACYPESASAADGAVTNVIVLLYDITKEAKVRRDLEAECRRSNDERQRLEKQNEELRERARALAKANNELAAANIELQSTNEHLLVAAQEAEASAEEVETLNEEMQATSEELETLNEELQATVEELNTTNEELNSRGREMERLAAERRELLDESERRLALFEGAIEKAPFAAALVDGSNTVVKASELYVRYAAANGPVLPKPGESWRDHEREVRLTTDGEGERTYDVAVISIADNGKIVTLQRR